MLIAFHKYDKIIKIVKTTLKKHKKAKLILPITLVEKGSRKIKI